MRIVSALILGLLEWRPHLELLRSRDRNDVVSLREQPGNGDLSRSRAVLLTDGCDSVH